MEHQHNSISNLYRNCVQRWNVGRHWLTGSGKRLPLSFTGTIKKAVRILSPAAGDQVATLKAEGLRTKPTSWKRVEWQKETTQNRWIGPRRKPTLPQTFDCHRPIDSFYHLSQSELCFPLLQKWPSILLTSYCSSDALCCRFRNRKAESGLRRSCLDTGDMSLHRWILTLFLGEEGRSGKFISKLMGRERQVSQQRHRWKDASCAWMRPSACSEGLGSQSQVGVGHCRAGVQGSCECRDGAGGCSSLVLVALNEVPERGGTISQQGPPAGTWQPELTSRLCHSTHGQVFKLSSLGFLFHKGDDDGCLACPTNFPGEGHASLMTPPMLNEEALF